MSGTGTTNTNEHAFFLFYFLNFISIILSVLVYTIFQENNFLIQSSSVICFLISFILLLGWPFESPHKHNTTYCDIQALFLNYCFISMHAHFAFAMWNNLAAAMRWKFLGIRDPNALLGLMVFISISIPIVPTIIILAYTLDPENINVFTRKSFFCVVNTPQWWGYRSWFVLFSIPGIIATCIVFYKTIESRQKMIELNSKSQFSKLQLARMFFALIVYLVASLFSIFLEFKEGKDDTIQIGDFMPTGVGFFLFITYGVGKTAFAFYTEIYNLIISFCGVEARRSRSSISSSGASTLDIPIRRPSSTNSTIVFTRRPSQLSESVDENFLYDSTDVQSEDSDDIATTYQIVQRNQIRRGSEPINRSVISNAKKYPIEIIPEVDEDVSQTEEDDT